MMKEPEFLELVALGEARGVELKGPMLLSDKSSIKVVKAALALSNRRDGGHIVVGVREAKLIQPEFVGLSLTKVKSWNYDDIADLFERYAEPRIEFTVERQPYDSKVFVILRISEFSDVPILCKKDSEVTVEGACYVYPIGKAKVKPIPGIQDMRELLDLAAEKRLRHLLAQVGQAGGEVVATTPSDAYDDQIKDFFD